MGHATHMDRSCHTYELVRSHIWMSHVTHMDESCHKYDCVMSHIWIHHVTHMNESCHTYECAMSHMRMSHITHMNKSCHTYERGATCVETCEAFCSAVFVTSNCAMSLSLCCSSPCDCATWLVDMGNSTLPYVRHDSFVCATPLIHMCDVTHSWPAWGCCSAWACLCDSPIRDITHFICVGDKTRSYAQLDTFIYGRNHSCAPRLTHTWQDSNGRPCFGRV